LTTAVRGAGLIQAARRDLRLPAELVKLDRFDLVILDDFSYARRVTFLREATRSSG
jgi:DNA replication protein DnaC